MKYIWNKKNQSFSKMFKGLWRASKWTGFDNDRFWWNFKIICFLVWVLLCPLLLCLSCKGKKLTFCAILWLCIFLVCLYFGHPLLAMSHYSVSSLMVFFIYCNEHFLWCCDFATPYWPGHSVATLFSQKLGSTRLEIFSNPQKTTSRCLCKFGEIKRTVYCDRIWKKIIIPNIL